MMTMGLKKRHETSHISFVLKSLIRADAFKSILNASKSVADVVQKIFSIRWFVGSLRTQDLSNIPPYRLDSLVLGFDAAC